MSIYDLRQITIFIGYSTILTLLTSLVLTLIIESLLCIPFIKKKKLNIKKLKDIALVNCLTNPVVAFIAYNFYAFWYNFMGHNYPIWFSSEIKLGYLIIVIVSETLVVLIEGKLFKKLLSGDINRPYLFSLYLNVLSYLIGFVLSSILFSL